MINAAIFEVDGTLVDSVDQHARAWQEAFAEFGYVIDSRPCAAGSAKATTNS